MNLDYIAGFFDGDGYTSLGFSKATGCRYGFHVRIEIGISQSRNQPRNIPKEIHDRLRFGKYREHGFMRTVCFRNFEEIGRFICLFKQRVLMKRGALNLLERALGILRSHRHYTRAGLLELLQIREELCKEVLPSRSGYARRIGRIAQLRELIVSTPEKFCFADASPGMRLRAARLRRGFTQKELAAAIGVTKQMISKYERSIRRPSTMRHSMIVKCLGDLDAPA
jgi:DNA-binding XRE family transcriptional regulator